MIHAGADRPSQTQNSGIVGESVNLTVVASARHAAFDRALPAHHAPAVHQVARSGEEPQAPSLRPAQAHRQGVARHLPGLHVGHLSGADPLPQSGGHGLRADHRRHYAAASADKRPIKVLLDPYNPIGSTSHVNFTTSKTEPLGDRLAPLPHQLGHPRQRLGGGVLPVAETIRACAPTSRTTTLGFDVPYRYGSESRIYRPDFIVLVEDGHGEDDLLHLVVEIKGYRREDAKDKKLTMETYWVPGVNNSGKFGRWAFAEFTEVFGMEADFADRVESEFKRSSIP